MIYYSTTVEFEDENEEDEDEEDEDEEDNMNWSLNKTRRVGFSNLVGLMIPTK